MTREELLLTQLAEEAAEIIKEVSKILRFGRKDVMPGQHLTNVERLQDELIDFKAVKEMLEEDAIIRTPEMERMQISSKKYKVEKYLKLSEELGRKTC